MIGITDSSTAKYIYLTGWDWIDRYKVSGFVWPVIPIDYHRTVYDEPYPISLVVCKLDERVDNSLEI